MSEVGPLITRHWPAALMSLAGAYCLWKLVSFARADGDFKLLSKRALPSQAFDGQVIWITGASQGLGAELARQFAAQGARLILSARSRERLEAVRQECSGSHAPADVRIMPLDVTAPYKTLAAIAAEADACFIGGIDVLVHNAGASQRCAAEEASPEVLEALLELNVEGTLKLTQAALPRLLAGAKGGREKQILVIGSMAGLMPAAGQAIYAACKASLAAYFRSLHSELCTRGVRVTLCHAGPMATGSARQLRSLYGPAGLLQERDSPAAESAKVPLRRAAELVLRASFHGLESCWIARHPVLLLAYLVQYVPSLGYWVLNKVGAARVRSYKAGGSGYDFSASDAGPGKKD